jgi:hypothetical protein
MNTTNNNGQPSVTWHAGNLDRRTKGKTAMSTMTLARAIDVHWVNDEYPGECVRPTVHPEAHDTDRFILVARIGRIESQVPGFTPDDISDHYTEISTHKTLTAARTHVAILKKRDYDGKPTDVYIRAFYDTETGRAWWAELPDDVSARATYTY